MLSKRSQAYKRLISFRWNVKTGIYTWASQVVLVVKNLPASAGDIRDASSNTGSGRSPGGGNGDPLQYSCLENPMDRGSGGLQSMGYKRVGQNLVTKQQQQNPHLTHDWTLTAAVGNCYHHSHCSGEQTQRNQAHVIQRRSSWDLTPHSFFPHGLVVAFNVGLHGDVYSGHFRFCWWTKLHFRGTHDCMSEGMWPENLISTSSGPALEP